MGILRRGRSGDPEDTLAVNIPEPVLDFFQSRCGLQGDPNAPALDLEYQRLASAHADDLLHVREAFDGPAVDRQNKIAWLKAGRLCGTSRLDGIDSRRGTRLSEDHEQARKNCNREYKVCERASDHDRGPACNRLIDEACLALLLGHLSECRLIRYACSVVIAKKLHVATKRNRRNLPSGIVTIMEAEQLGTE